MPMSGWHAYCANSRNWKPFFGALALDNQAFASPLEFGCK